jgi:hypothetical protein
VVAHLHHLTFPAFNDAPLRPIDLFDPFRPATPSFRQSTAPSPRERDRVTTSAFAAEAAALVEYIPVGVAARFITRT